MLLKAKARIENCGRLACGVTPVHIAAADGNYDALNLMFNSNKDVFFQTLFWKDVRGAIPVPIFSIYLIF